MPKVSPDDDSVELDDMFAVDSDEEEAKDGDKVDAGKYTEANSGDDSNPLLRERQSEDDNKISARWKNDAGSSEHFMRQCFSRKNICRISLVAVLVFVVMAVGGAVIYKKSIPKSNPPLISTPSVKISAHWKGFDKIENWFAFGDSWTDNDFHAYEAQPSRENPFGNPDVASRDIWNYAAYMTLRYNHSFIKMRDLAWSSSTIDSTYDSGFLYWLDFAHQVHDVFQKQYIINETGIIRGKDWNPDDTMFSAFFGINDVFVYNHTHPQWNEVFESYSNYLEELYEASARIFLIINIPPVNLAPSSPGDESKDTPEFREVVRNFNIKVANVTQHLRDKHDDVTVFSFDMHKLIQQIHDDPKSVPQTAGIKDVNNFCVAYKASHPWYNPPKNLTETCRGLELQEYLWRDELHTTAPVHEAIAVRIEQMFMNFTNSK